MIREHSCARLPKSEARFGGDDGFRRHFWFFGGRGELGRELKLSMWMWLRLVGFGIGLAG